jgi:hypothetical protein
MPVAYDMSWIPSLRRWSKMQFGKRYVVSCRQLKKLGYLPVNSPETKEYSRDAANRWLADTLGDIKTVQQGLQSQHLWISQVMEVVKNLRPPMEDLLKKPREQWTTEDLQKNPGGKCWMQFPNLRGNRLIVT